MVRESCRPGPCVGAGPARAVVRQWAGCATGLYDGTGMVRESRRPGQCVGAGSAGVVVVNGRGVPQDYAPAQQWWEKRALQGSPPAQVHLGWLYKLRQGVSQDNVRACIWFN